MMNCDEYSLALTIGPDKTVKEAAAMMNGLYKADLMVEPFNWDDLDEDGLSLVVVYDKKDEDAVRELVADLGFKEDWDTMFDWDTYDEDEEGKE